VASPRSRTASIPAIFLLLAACTSGRGLPPLWEHEEGLPGNAVEDREVFGFSSRTRGEDGALLDAIRPFTAKVEDAEGVAMKRHYFPPIASHVENERGTKTAVWPFFSTSDFGDDDERREKKSDEDTWIFPLVGWGRAPQGHGDWFALFPIYGKLRGTFLADEVDFVMFPAYAHTDSGDWHSNHVLWPFIAWGSSPDKSHFRVIPLWSQTDSPHLHNRTVLWPVFNWGHDVHGERTFDYWSAWPLVSRRASRDGQYREISLLWPFFEFAHDDKQGDDYVAAPWPLYLRSIKPGVSEQRWFWPFYGTFDSTTERSRFYAWPLVWTGDREENGRAFHHTYVVPLWMQRSSGNVGGEIDDKEVRSWPLFSWHRRGDGVTTGRFPDLIPVFGWEAGETCYSDLLALVRWSSDKAGREAWDGPLGAVRYRRDVAGAKSLTLLWWIKIPLGGGR